MRKFHEAMAHADQVMAGLGSTGGFTGEFPELKEGHRRISGSRLPLQSVLHMQRFMEGIKSGSMSKLEMMLKIREAQGTSDFTYLMGDNLWRSLLAQYSTVPASWPFIGYRRVVNDFRNFRAIAVDGATAPLDPVSEQGPYQQRLLADSKYDVSVAKFGDKMGFSWESFINDDQEGLRRGPMLLGQGARNLEEKNFTNLYAGNATLYSTANKNIITVTNGASSTNPVLSPGAISDGLTVMRRQLNSDGSPIMIDGVTLVVPTALHEQATRIMAAAQIWWNELGGTTNTRVLTGNTLSARVKVVCAPWLDTINASSHGATQWYLFADPNQGRPALQIAFLRGHEQPEMWQRASNAQLVGGGMDDFANGSFENDTIEYKIRHVVGFAVMDPKATVTSNGTGS